MRLIDADKIHPDRMTNKGTVAISQSQLAKAETVNAIKIPQNATNGDVFTTMFPNVVIGYPSDCNSILLEVKRDGRTAFGGIYTDWWNAPYKVGE